MCIYKERERERDRYIYIYIYIYTHIHIYAPPSRPRACRAPWPSLRTSGRTAVRMQPHYVQCTIVNRIMYTIIMIE